MGDIMLTNSIYLLDLRTDSDIIAILPIILPIAVVFALVLMSRQKKSAVDAVEYFNEEIQISIMEDWDTGRTEVTTEPTITPKCKKQSYIEDAKLKNDTKSVIGAFMGTGTENVTASAQVPQGQLPRNPKDYIVEGATRTQEELEEEFRQQAQGKSAAEGVALGVTYGLKSIGSMMAKEALKSKNNRR